MCGKVYSRNLSPKTNVNATTNEIIEGSNRPAVPSQIKNHVRYVFGNDRVCNDTALTRPCDKAK
jgi:hypothetical protein